jgi:hypothetical protein
MGRGLRRRQKNATEASAGRFEKAAPDARSAPPRGSRVAHELEDDCGSAIDRAILFTVWMAGGGIKGARPTARATSSASRRRRTPPTATTSMRRRCACSASTTRSSRSTTTASSGGLADVGFGWLRDQQVPLPFVFGGFAALAGLSAWLVLQIRVPSDYRSW